MRTTSVRWGIRALVATVAVAMAATFSQAHAAGATDSPQPSVMNAEVLMTVDRLPSGDLAVNNLSTGRNYLVDQGGRLSASASQSSAPLAASPIAKCGVESYGPGGFFKRPYCDFTRTGQKMLIAGGLAAGAAAICAATSGILCIVAAGAAAALFEYLSDHGLCSGNARVGYSGVFSVRCL
jgi:hypothetical protein